MKYLLDTNILVDHIRGLNRIPSGLIKDGFATSVISVAELLYGAEKSSNRRGNLRMIWEAVSDLQIEVLDINTPVVEEYAKVRIELEKEGQRLENFDLLIAATAVSSEVTLVTNNKKHFDRIKNLKLLK